METKKEARKINLSQLRISEFKQKHLESVLEIEKLVNPCPWSEKMFLGELDNAYNYNFVAHINDVIVGYLCMSLIDLQLHIMNIAVHPDFQGKGTGSKLLKYGLKLAKDLGMQMGFLELRESNTRAYELYNRYGFKTICRRRDYYGPKHDAIVMQIENLQEIEL